MGENPNVLPTTKVHAIRSHLEYSFEKEELSPPYDQKDRLSLS